MTTFSKCPEIAELLSAYLDDALPPDTRQGVAAHLAICAECRKGLADLKCTRRLLRALPREPMPDGLKQHLLESFRNRRRPPD